MVKWVKGVKGTKLLVTKVRHGDVIYSIVTVVNTALHI